MSTEPVSPPTPAEPSAPRIDRVAGLADALDALLATRGPGVELLALGEPAHGELAFPVVRNALFRLLVERGFRSVALETDAVAALRLADVVDGGDAEDGAAVRAGFSHGLGALAANRELIGWMRAYNAGRPPAERLTVHGIDPPLEMISAPSPRASLLRLHDHLAEHLGAPELPHSRDELDALLGADARWSAAAAVFDAARSIGADPAAVALRVAVDDLLVLLAAHAPALVAATSAEQQRRAELCGRTARGLLCYHAAAARPDDPTRRTARMLGVRDALMLENLLALRAHERHRGPTLVFAHNRHLQRHPSTWRLAGMDLEWSGAGALLAALPGRRDLFVAGALGSGPRLGLGPAPAGTLEAALDALVGGRSAVIPAEQAAAATADHPEPRTDTTPEQGYFPLDVPTVRDAHAVLYLTAGPGSPARPSGVPVPELAARIAALPGVEQVVAEPGPQVPPSMWGSRYFYVGQERAMPFATVVERDTPDWDERSDLDRPGVYRLNIQLGRAEFERCFGYLPAAAEQHADQVDHTALDRLLPHPQYGGQGWGCLLNPTPERLPEIDRLIGYAHERAVRRAARKADRSG